ncbi:hypothetical protein [Desulfoluna butyratoxydans]|uniref:Uncharacterized protein n=1 Tax=Desulfoluna butyratoxydans TaxID=231438 RepID=A0A4U8YQ55_9BACT|nr:hypothetical protein [Desulfoluna butyratoxydans]VFQ43852.1 hypothetical protein MSL71_14930 [Desulfoluna butyratoxydans]
MGTAVTSQYPHHIEWGGALTTWGDSLFTWEAANSIHHVLDISETATLSDSTAKEIFLPFTEDLAVHDDFARETTFMRSHATRVTVGEEIIKQTNKPCAEICELSDITAKYIALNRGESVAVAEVETDPTDYSRNYYETVSIADSIAKQVAKPAGSKISIRDAFIKPFLSGVTSDVSLVTEDMTGVSAENFAKNDYPAGMVPWRPFVDGEYEYQDALIRLSVKDNTPGGQTETRLEQEVIVCDVEDVIDAGTAVVSGVQRVEFNRKFTSPPIVTPTVRTCNDFAIPEVVSTDKTGFEIRLRKVDDTNADGSVNWQAKGY